MAPLNDQCSTSGSEGKGLAKWTKSGLIAIENRFQFQGLWLLLLRLILNKQGEETLAGSPLSGLIKNQTLGLLPGTSRNARQLSSVCNRWHRNG